MTANQLVPAIQYLRMPTEHQPCSLENQSTPIQKDAKSDIATTEIRPGLNDLPLGTMNVFENHLSPKTWKSPFSTI